MIDDDGPGQPLPLVYEPDAFGSDRLVVMTDGWILWTPVTEIERAVAGRNDEAHAHAADGRRRAPSRQLTVRFIGRDGTSGR
jgi:hypothetical protein